MQHEIPGSHDATADDAIAWLIRLRSDDVALSQRRQFSIWMACPAHRAAFDEVLQLWDALGCVRWLLPVVPSHPDLRGRG
jgi:ferric-dicitrate binding protein FerR (iron transport regulator)